MRRLAYWIRDSFSGATLTRPPIPGPNDLHRYLHKLFEVASKAAANLARAQVALGAQQVAVATFDSRSQRRTRRSRKRHARADKRVSPHGIEPPSPSSLTIFDPLVSRLVVYLATFGITVATLETVSTYSTMIVFDGTLGSSRLPIAIAAGAILALCGHACGHGFFTAARAESLVKRLLFGLTSAVVIVAIGAIVWTGLDRSANEEARGLGKEATILLSEQGKLEGKARELEAPQPPLEDSAERPSKANLKRAARLRREAAARGRQAGRLEEKSASVRSLDFLAGIQLLGLAVGTFGGWLFAEAAPLRVARLRARLAALRSLIESIVLDEEGIAREAYGHWLAMMATEGIDLHEFGLPDFHPERHIVTEISSPTSNGHGPVSGAIGGRP